MLVQGFLPHPPPHQNDGGAEINMHPIGSPAYFLDKGRAVICLLGGNVYVRLRQVQLIC